MRILRSTHWKVKIHGKGRPRKWIKVHVAVDAKTQEIVAVATTESSTHDSQMIKSLLETVPASVNLVIADGAYDGTNSREAIRQKKAQALIPPPKNARDRGLDDERDQALRLIKGLGGDKKAKSLWGKMTGYSRRALVETAFSRFKGLYGERFFSKTSKRQAVESFLRCLLLNKMRLEKA